MNYNNRCSRISGRGPGKIHGGGVRLRPKPGDGGARASGVGKRGSVSEDGVDLQQRTAGAVGAFGGAQRLKGRPRHIPGRELPEGPGEAHLLPARRPTRSWRRGASPAPPTARRPSNGASPCPRRRDSTSPGTGRSSHARRHPSTERRTKHCMHLSYYLTNCRTVFLLQELNIEIRKS